MSNQGTKTRERGREAPAPPSAPGWETANAEYETGRVVRLSFKAPTGEQVPFAVTLGWLGAWSHTPLTQAQRSAIHTACIQIAKDRVHPCLGRRRVESEPVGSWMASPCPGVTVTWRPHWSADGLPVMLTLEVLDPQVAVGSPAHA